MKTTKTLFVLVLLLLAVAVYPGWVTFSKSAGKATIKIDTLEVWQDAQKAIDAGKELLDKAKASVTKLSRVRPTTRRLPFQIQSRMATRSPRSERGRGI